MQGALTEVLGAIYEHDSQLLDLPMRVSRTMRAIVDHSSVIWHFAQSGSAPGGQAKGNWNSPRARAGRQRPMQALFLVIALARAIRQVVAQRSGGDWHEYRIRSNAVRIG